MRLGWPFRRQADAVGPSDGGERPAGSRERVPHDEAWRGLQPPRGLSAPPPLTGDETFGSTLAGSRPLPPVLARLADARPLGPTLGPVASSLSPRSSTYAGGTAFRDALRQPTDRPGAPDAGGPLPDQEPRAVGEQAGGAGPGASIELPAAPVPHRLQPLARTTPQRAPLEGAGGRGSMRLTAVAAADRPALAVARPGRISLSVPSAPSLAAAAPDAPSSGSPETASASAHADRSSGDEQRPALRERRQLSLREGHDAHTVGGPVKRPQRAGLGAPLVAQRAAAGEEGHGRQEATGAAGLPVPMVAHDTPRAAPSEADGWAGRSPGAESGPGRSRPAPLTPTPVVHVRVPQAAASEAADALPVAAPSRAVQRAAIGAAPPAAPDVKAGTGIAGGVRVERSSEASEAARGLGAAAFTAGDTIVLPAAHGPLDRGRGQELLAHELVHVRQQRRLGSALPEESSSAGQALERQARSAEVAVQHARRAQAGLAHPLVSRPRRSHPGGDLDVGQAASVALAQPERGSTSSVEGLGESMAPTGLSGPGTAAASTHAAAGTQRAAIGSASVAAPSPATEQGDAELEELARKLYDRIGQRLRRELLLDRERSGLLTDLR